MKVAISNIAWGPELDQKIAPVLREEGVSAVEVAPTRYWPDPTQVTNAEVAACRAKWDGLGLSVIALQSLLYGRPDLQVFAAQPIRDATRQHLVSMIQLGSELGAKVLVFGAPKNRLRGDVSAKRAFTIAVDFFHDLAIVAADHATVLCIEANPTSYSADFVTRSSEALELVRAVDHPGFRLHLDTACMSLAGEDPKTAIDSGIDVLAHVHVSEPYLGPVGTFSEIDHAYIAEVLREVGYTGFVSVEMRPTGAPESIDAIRRAARFAVETYGARRDVV